MGTNCVPNYIHRTAGCSSYQSCTIKFPLKLCVDAGCSGIIHCNLFASTHRFRQIERCLWYIEHQNFIFKNRSLNTINQHVKRSRMHTGCIPHYLVRTCPSSRLYRCTIKIPEIGCIRTCSSIKAYHNRRCNTSRIVIECERWSGEGNNYNLLSYIIGTCSIRNTQLNAIGTWCIPLHFHRTIARA